MTIVSSVQPRVSKGHADLASSSPSSPAFIREANKGKSKVKSVKSKVDAFCIYFQLVTFYFSLAFATLRAQRRGQSRLTRITDNEGCVR